MNQQDLDFGRVLRKLLQATGAWRLGVQPVPMREMSRIRPDRLAGEGSRDVPPAT